MLACLQWYLIFGYCELICGSGLIGIMLGSETHFWVLLFCMPDSTFIFVLAFGAGMGYDTGVGCFCYWHVIFFISGLFLGDEMGTAGMVPMYQLIDWYREGVVSVWF